MEWVMPGLPNLRNPMVLSPLSSLAPLACEDGQGTVVPAKSDSDVILCLQLLSKNNLYTLLDLMRIDRSLVY